MATNLVTQITKLAQRAAQEDKAIRALAVTANTAIGDTTTLTTSTRTSLVAALNELKSLIDGINTNGVAEINDAAALNATDKTWSISKIDAQIKAAIAALVGGAPAALDTLNELAVKLNDEADLVAGLVTQIATKANSADVYTKTAADAATSAAITTAIAPLATATSVTTAKAAADAAQADVDALETAIGMVDTSDNYFADIFATALTNAG